MYSSESTTGTQKPRRSRIHTPGSSGRIKPNHQFPQTLAHPQATNRKTSAHNGSTSAVLCRNLQINSNPPRAWNPVPTDWIHHNHTNLLDQNTIQNPSAPAIYPTTTTTTRWGNHGYCFIYGFYRDTASKSQLCENVPRNILYQWNHQSRGKRNRHRNPTVPETHQLQNNNDKAIPKGTEYEKLGPVGTANGIYHRTRWVYPKNTVGRIYQLAQQVRDLDDIRFNRH